MDPTQQRPAFAGIDWGGHEHQLCVVDGDGRKQLELRVNHDIAMKRSPPMPLRQSLLGFASPSTWFRPLPAGSSGTSRRGGPRWRSSRRRPRWASSS